ncbi:uncharacterized protein N7525_005075, partial [Penicillium rubens]|uniref:uncharacterized protein n=1 Tax=Penicillium rubens TaxID=1108849 RepID=UPI002A59FC6F
MPSGAYREDAALTTLGPACITCREKCRKCDRTKPVCQRCITKGLECKGYPDKFRFAGLATRGKWKNRAVPTVSRDHAVRTQPGTGIDHPDTSHEESESDQRHPSALPSCEDRNIERLPILDHPWPQSEGRSVELDDLLMLERTELLLAHCIFESGISTHGAHITGALSICNQLRLSDTLCRENERTIFFLGNLAWQVLSSYFHPDAYPTRLDIIRSLADARRLCFSPELRAAVATLSDLKFERVNGCPREIFLIIGNVMEHAKAHATGKMGTAEYERLLNACRYELYSWSLKPDRYPNDNPRWPAVAEAFRHACILHTSRLLDMAQPAEAPIIQKSVTAILDSLAEIPADCRLIELVVMPIFMAGADALSPYARHYLLLRFDHIRSHGGVSSEMSVSLLKSVWNARGRQAKHDSRNIPWVWF